MSFVVVRRAPESFRPELDGPQNSPSTPPLWGTPVDYGSLDLNAAAYEDGTIFAVRIHDDHVQVHDERNGS